MHWINNTDKERMIIKSYPLILVSFPAVLMLVAIIAVIFQDHDVKLVDGLIFFGICIGFMSFHKCKKTVFDKNLNECIMSEQNLFSQKDSTILLSDIEAFEMSFGRGSGYARGGVLNMKIKDGAEVHIIDSDIQRNHEQKMTKAKDTIERFIENGVR